VTLWSTVEPERPLCYPRKRFASRQAADSAVIQIYKRTQVTRTPKRCKVCDGYHLN
jgi:hypothetical protein